MCSSENTCSLIYLGRNFELMILAVTSPFITGRRREGFNGEGMSAARGEGELVPGLGTRHSKAVGGTLDTGSGLCSSPVRRLHGERERER